MFAHIGRAGRRRQFYRSTLGSLLVHAALIGLLVWRAGEDFAGLLVGNDVPGPGIGTGPTAGPAGGGGGGESVEYIEIAAPAPPPEIEPVVVPAEAEVLPPVTTPEVPELSAPTPAPTEPAPPAAQAPGGVGPGEGGGVGAGVGPGALGGSGGGTGGGIGSAVGPGTGGGGGGEGSIRPPVPMSVILPPTPPPRVRGRTVELRLSVDARGAVRQVEIVTPTGDRAFDNRLRRTALDWRFQPARDPENRPVAAQVPISFSF